MFYLTITIVKILLLIFASTLIMLLGAYSTVASARIRRTTLVYELVCGLLIYSDGNLILGTIEFIVFQIMAIFSAIACLYAYAEVDIEEQSKGTPNENCTALITLPLQRQKVEVTRDTIHSISTLSIIVLIVCFAMLLVIRPVLLFPFYGKNAVLFMFSLMILVINGAIASETNRRSADMFKDNSVVDVFEALFCAMFFVYLAYGVIQGVAGLCYIGADDKAKETVVSSVPRAYGEMLPITEFYNYEKEIDWYLTNSIDKTDNKTYLIFHDRYSDGSGNRYYCYFAGFNEIKSITNNSANGVFIHIIKDDSAPHAVITDNFYINPRGEEKILSTTYEFYVTEEQILTVK